MDRKPVEAIKRLRNWADREYFGLHPHREVTAVVAYLDSIPADAVCVVWPAHLTREFLLRLIDDLATSVDGPTMNLVRAIQDLAAIAPVRKKRVVNLWERIRNDQYRGDLRIAPTDEEWDSSTWKLVARNVELED